MTAERQRKRCVIAGCTVAMLASVGLVALALLYRAAPLNDGAVYSLVFVLTGLMGVGATVAIFSIKHS